MHDLRFNTHLRPGVHTRRSDDGRAPLRSVLCRLDSRAVSAASLREVRNREVHLPPVSVYRWWARRSEAVFGAILDAFCEEYGRPTLVVDPFSGGGVIPLATVLRGYRVYAQDLNPWATEGLSAMLQLPEPEQILRLKCALREAAEPSLRKAYATAFSDGTAATISHTFRVAAATCSACGTRNRMFPHAMVSLLTRKERGQPDAILSCPRGHLFFGQIGTVRRCPECEAVTDPEAVYTSGRTVKCWNCGHSEKLQERASRGDWEWQIVMVERTACNRRELALASATDIEQADATCWQPTLEFGCIPEGQETRVLIRHGFRCWEDLYPRRQRVLLETLLGLAGQMAREPRDWTALQMAICGSAEMAGFLSRWDRWYLKSYEAMAGHRFNFTTLPVEPNVWGAIRSGRGTVQRRLDLFSKASAWLEERLGDELIVAGPTPAGTGRRALPKDCDACIVEGSSERINLRCGSADLVLTDPPYHDDVQYDELSLPLRAWSKLSITKLDNEAVVHAGTGTKRAPRSYRALLVRLFSECRRVLNPRGRLILSYANREPDAWVDLFSALQAARFRGLGYSIVHSENETDHAKRGVRACALDLIMELTRQLDIAVIQSRPGSTLDGPEAEFLTVIGDTFLRLGKLDQWEDDFVTALKASRFLQGASSRASAGKRTRKSGRT